jgi:photosystem II stability/assembly factor-like uncharacterized protein
MRNNKPEWYEQAGKEPFKRNHFHGNLATGVKNRIGTEKQPRSRTRWYLGGSAAVVMGTMIVISSFFSDSGSDHSPVPVPSNSPAANAIIENPSERIRMVDKKNGWAFGTSVMHTNDGGKTWADRTPKGYDHSRFEPFLFNEQLAWFVVRPADKETAQTTNWMIYRTTDGGNSWIPATLPTKDTWTVQGINTAFNLYFIDEKTGFFSFVSDPAGGPVQTAFYQTTDGGETWKYVNKIAPDGVLASTPSGMSFSDRLHGFITFYNSRDYQPEIYGTTSGGASWNRIVFDLPKEIKDAVFFAEHPPVFFGNTKKEGVLSISYMTKNNEKAGVAWFITENGGATWSPTTRPESQPTINTKGGSAPLGFRACAALDLRHFWMIDAESGTLYGTSDGGGRWQALYTSPQLRNAAQLKFIDEKTGWVRGDGFLLQTEDGGKSWNEL